MLEWWQDLLGTQLTSHAHLLCAPGDNPDNARRQVHAWQHENRPPDQITIERWCKISWADKYAGAFVDDAQLPLHERWNRCRAFLVEKRLHTTENWLQDVTGKPKEIFQKQYRGERLEKEILPFKEASFAAFFDSPDPIVAGLPVSELIERIAERWAKPTNGQLKARLLIAAGFQRAFTNSVDSLGLPPTIRIFDWFQEVYCFLMSLNNRGGDKQGILRMLQNTPASQLALRYSCEWLWDESAWRALPIEIASLLRSQAPPDTKPNR